MATKEADSVELRVKLFKKTVFDICPDYVVNEKNRDLLNDIFKYCNFMDGKYNSMKGLWLWGSIGTGKSTLLNIVSTYMKRQYPMPMIKSYHNEPYSGGFKIYNCTKVANDYGKSAKEGSQGLDPYLNKIEIGFDELGREPIPVKSYGTEMNVMQYIFQTRYENYRLARTHVTTNLDPDSIGDLDLYGPYISDRVKEMFNIINMNGKSFRK
ncbi:hypothetical protein CLV62_12535 [Dysgonomonas alginatilytica]|uniref:DNA replication protein DnaC n=1 Tax=Dysgonomonas alginatilytica TaxID=1605892 RepID=A0A2V3PK09_9BACT|nr:hypothetical protein [Dysgonomonas alginatilytica]PXV61202.1 hypothetical protein CLV62_12535 [Dysgonomonas alginatilytica]